MPDSALTQASIKQLALTYWSMFAILFLLVAAALALSEVSWFRTIHLHDVSAQVNAQELRTQNMFYNVLLLQSPGVAPGTTYQSITAEVANDERLWEAQQAAMYGNDPRKGVSAGDFDSLASRVLAQEKPGFLVMEAAYRRVLATEHARNPAPPAVVRPDIEIIYLQERPYVASLIAVASDFSTATNGMLQGVRQIVALLASVALLVIIAEAFFVARPAVKRLQQQMKLSAKILHLEETLHKEET